MRGATARCGAIVLLALLLTAGTAGAQAPAPPFGGQIVYSTVTVQPGEFKTWTVTCPKGYVQVGQWIGPRPAQVNAWYASAPSGGRTAVFRASSTSTVATQITVAVTCVKPRPVKLKAGTTLRIVIRPKRVRFTVQPGATKTVRLECPADTALLSSGVAPVSTRTRVLALSDARAFPDGAHVVDLITAEDLAKVTTRNGGTTAVELLAHANCGQLVSDEESEAIDVTLRGIRQRIAEDIFERTGRCPSGSFPVGAGFDAPSGLDVAALLAPAGRRGVEFLLDLGELPAAPRTFEFLVTCLDGEILGIRGTPPKFTTNRTPVSTAPAPTTPTPSTPTPTAPTGRATFTLFVDPFEMDFTAVFDQAGSGFAIELGNGTVTNSLDPPGFTCTRTMRRYECLGNVGAAAPITGRVRQSAAFSSGQTSRLLFRSIEGTFTDVGGYAIP
ncbi:hypothetical protein LRS13_09100 [Svornostia abyssi]|uniref:Uncharacterized protein n=1 Tax=Svornostia abyssi TaxID=2898438 RepID=A0ABY5PLX5_9ACTN|nr:hypothetical protein LRS13_09100 [Parviterribacteraceae bacterium J379]